VAQAATLCLGRQARKPLLGSIGPQTSAALQQAGLPVDFAAKTPGLEALVEALVRKLGK